MKVFTTPIGTSVGENKPLFKDIGLAVPVIPLRKVPPKGLTLIRYCELISHKLGIGVMVGVGGLTAVMVIRRHMLMLPILLAHRKTCQFS